MNTDISPEDSPETEEGRDVTFISEHTWGQFVSQGAVPSSSDPHRAKMVNFQRALQRDETARGQGTPSRP